MDAWLSAVIASVSSIAASSGFWAYVTKKSSNKSATTRLLMGLAYDKISTVGLKYVERGWISKDEYEDFRKYLYEPYKELGGNGVAERIMQEVSQLKLTTPRDIGYDKIIEAKRGIEGKHDSQ